MTDCQLCERPIVDTAYVCKHDADRVAKRLALAGELWTEVAVAIARQDRYGDRVRLSNTEPPLPLRLGVAYESDAIINTMTTWARHIVEQSGRKPPRDHVALLAGWLAEQCEWLRYRPEAAEALDELEDAASLVVRIIDAPAARAYLGPCGEDGCKGELYALPGRTVRCRECGTVHDPEARKAWLAAEAANVVGTAADMARWCSALLHDMVTADTIRGLARRGRIAAVADVNGRPLYRVGDVTAVIGARMAA